LRVPTFVWRRENDEDLEKHQAGPFKQIRIPAKEELHPKEAAMFRSIRRAVWCVPVLTALAIMTPVATLRADSQDDQQQQEAERRAAEERQRDLDEWAEQQRRSADEWQRQQAEQARQMAETRERDMDEWRAQQQKLNDEWQQQQEEQAKQAAA